jgi:carbamoyl-phosphate synthase/aspartate carbamoyltransferase/dihydroorotase
MKSSLWSLEIGDSYPAGISNLNLLNRCGKTNTELTIMKLPGLIDVHVHLREPGQTHKEDFSSGTAAALSGGVTIVLAMPNTNPPLVDVGSFQLALNAARQKAHCDYGIFVGANLTNAAEISALAPQTAGLKMYLDVTFGPLLLDDTTAWMQHFEHWPENRPIVAHAEGANIPALIFVASLFNRHVHICHVARREEILMIRSAKEKGHPVTCEVGPHHLFLSIDDFERLSLAGKYPGRKEVRPRLATPQDQLALWENLEFIDCFATDHAPHTLAEKDSDNPPPGFPGVDAALPLYLTALQAGRLTLDDIVTRMHTNPCQIFELPEQPDTWVEIDPDVEYTLRGAQSHSKSKWTPFEGWQVKGRVERVVLRGQTVYENGKIVVGAGYGKNIRK